MNFIVMISEYHPASNDAYCDTVDTALNIRLFLAKMIINMPEAFEMYAHSWLRPLMRLAIEGESYGEAMNYFVRVRKLSRTTLAGIVFSLVLHCI